MLLTIDVGNTHTGFALFERHTMRGEWRLATNVERTGDEYAALLDRLCELHGLNWSGITAVAVSCVVPQTLFQLQQLCKRYLHCTPAVVGRDGFVPKMRVNLLAPAEVGADRLVNAFAAREQYGNNVIIVDFGTATTFDVVGDDGAYEGGVIAPGVQLSLKALHSAAAKLPNIAVERPAAAIGRSTVSAMQSGVYYGYLGMIEGIVLRIRHECIKPMRVIATGGLAPLFAQENAIIDQLDENLTMQGLRLLHASLYDGEVR